MKNDGIYTLSVILNLHQEGELAKKSIINLMAMVAYANNQAQSWSNIELIAILDDPDDITLDVIKQFSDNFARIEIVKYCDPALSRNHGVSLASNNFIIFIDGDDYCSIESLFAIYTTCYQYYHSIVQNLAEFNLLNDDKQIAVAPSRCVEFPNICVQKYVDSNNEIKYNMMFMHLYVSRICCPKKILIKNQSQKNTPPYGYEDWDLNNSILASGVKFKVADGFILFYRTNNANSVLSRHMANNCVVRYSKLYEQDVKFIINNCSYKDKSALWLFWTGNATKYLRYPLKILKLLWKRIAVFTVNKWPNLVPRYKKYLDFLYAMEENNLEIKNTGENDNYWYRNHISNEVNCFSQLTLFLKSADVIFFVSLTDTMDRNNINRLLQKLKQDGRMVKIVETSVYSNYYMFSEYEHLHIGRKNHLWQSLSDVTFLHVLLKSIIASNIKSLYIVDSVPLLQMVEYYASTLKEFNIEVIRL